MDSKTIERRGRDLSKATTANEPPSTLLSILADLRSGVKASEEVLRSTKIGIIVNRLKTHKDTTVAQQAGDLVSKWRKDVKGGGGGKPNGSPGGAVNGGTTTKKEGEKVNGAEETEKKVPPEQRNAKADGVKTAVTGDATRDACVKLMYDGLAYTSEEPPSHILPLATAIEASAHDLLPPPAYKEKMRSLFQTLKSRSGHHLRDGLLGRPGAPSITPARFVRMSDEELKSEERREEDARMEKENMDMAMTPQEERSVSASLQCGKCHERKVSYSQAQTRSADEPMTTFCECMNCGNRWKFS